MANNDKNNISVASTMFVEQSIGYNLTGTQKIGLVGLIMMVMNYIN